MRNISKFILALIVSSLLLNANLSAANLSPLQEVLNSREYLQKAQTEEARRALRKKFERARRQPLIDATQNTVLGIFAQMGIAFTVGWVAGNEGSSLAWFSAISQSIAQAWETGKAWISHLKHGGKDTLSQLEACAMDSMSDYPHSVLSEIVRAGETARIDAYKRGESIGRLMQLIQLRLNAPLPPLASITKIKASHELAHDFYKLLTDTYDPESNKGLKMLALELSTFVWNVVNGTSSIQYISISGLPGVGKTETAKKVYQMLLDILGQESVHLFQAVLQDVSEIEGNNNTPSMILKATGAARNNKQARGLFVVMDEGATQLNQSVDSAKRAFNSKTEISGGHFLGTHQTFTAMPTIVFILSNDPINDTALATRMTLAHFEKPTTSALKAHAKAFSRQYEIGTNTPPLTNQEVQTIGNDAINFRDVEARVKALTVEKILAHNPAPTSKKPKRKIKP